MHGVVAIPLQELQRLFVPVLAEEGLLAIVRLRSRAGRGDVCTWYALPAVGVQRVATPRPPSRQVASKAVYLLNQLLTAHPVMKPVVVREVSGRRIRLRAMRPCACRVARPAVAPVSANTGTASLIDRLSTSCAGRK